MTIINTNTRYVALLRGINVGGNNITKLPIYKQMTIRNWNTTTKLLTKLVET